MWVSVSNQAYVFLCCVIGGIIIAFVYDIFRIRRKTIKSTNLIVYLEDFIYWLIVALILFGVVYASNDGEIRGYLIIGIVLGVVIYVLLLSKIIMAAFMFVIRIIFKVLVTVFNIVSFPIRIVYKIVRVPAKLVGNLVRRGAGRARRIGRNRLDKMKAWKRILKNVRKKI